MPLVFHSISIPSKRSRCIESGGKVSRLFYGLGQIIALNFLIFRWWPYDGARTPPRCPILLVSQMVFNKWWSLQTNSTSATFLKASTTNSTAFAVNTTFFRGSSTESNTFHSYSNCCISCTTPHSKRLCHTPPSCARFNHPLHVAKLTIARKSRFCTAEAERWSSSSSILILWPCLFLVAYVSLFRNGDDKILPHSRYCEPTYAPLSAMPQ